MANRLIWMLVAGLTLAATSASTAPGDRPGCEEEMVAAGNAQEALSRTLDPTPQEKKARDDANQSLYECRRAQDQREAKEFEGRKERKRSAAEKAENDHLAQFEQDAGVYVPAYSAALCSIQKARASAKDEIRRELQYAQQGGGIVDKARLYREQRKMRDADDQEPVVRVRLKGEKPLRCSDAHVQAVFRCRDEGGNCSGATRDALTLLLNWGRDGYVKSLE